MAPDQPLHLALHIGGLDMQPAADFIKSQEIAVVRLHHPSAAPGSGRFPFWTANESAIASAAWPIRAATMRRVPASLYAREISAPAAVPIADRAPTKLKPFVRAYPCTNPMI